MINDRYQIKPTLKHQLAECVYKLDLPQFYFQCWWFTGVNHASLPFSILNSSVGKQAHKLQQAVSFLKWSEAANSWKCIEQRTIPNTSRRALDGRSAYWHGDTYNEWFNRDPQFLHASQHSWRRIYPRSNLRQGPALFALYHRLLPVLFW